MAWTGEVYRRIGAARPIEHGLMTEIQFFECGHAQRSVMSLIDIGRLENPVILCFQCSRQNWDRLNAQKRDIPLEDVLEILRAMPEP
jgi:hypothetical protein